MLCQLPGCCDVLDQRRDNDTSKSNSSTLHVDNTQAADYLNNTEDEQSQRSLISAADTASSIEPPPQPSLEEDGNGSVSYKIVALVADRSQENDMVENGNSLSPSDNATYITSRKTMEKDSPVLINRDNSNSTDNRMNEFSEKIQTIPNDVKESNDMGSQQPRNMAASNDMIYNRLDDPQVIDNLKDILEEINYLNTEEQLLRAWIRAEAYLRFLARLSDKTEPGVSKISKSEAETMANEFTNSKLYTIISTKIRILFDVFKTFNLEDRFDVMELAKDGTFVAGCFRSRLQSKESYSEIFESPREPETIHDSVPTNLSYYPSSSGHFFKRKFSSLNKKKEDKKHLKQDSIGTPVSKKSKRFSLRRHKHSKEKETPGYIPYSSTTQNGFAQQGWSEDNHKGLILAHKVNQNGSISVRIRAKIRIPLFQILAILYEIEFYDKWVPYCKKCNNAGDLSRASMILQQICDYPWPIKQKENLSYCFGVDTLEDFGCIIITSHGFPDGVTTFLDHPLPLPQKKIPRVPSSNFLFILSPVEEGNGTEVELFALVDPGITTLRSVILPIVKMSVKGFFTKIGYLATHFETSGYAAKVKNNPEVYDWIKRRIKSNPSPRKLRTGSSLVTLVFDELKDGGK